MRRLVVPLLLAALSSARPVAGQVVRGVVLDETDQSPIEGAMVVLLDQGQAVRRVLTDAAGAFLVQATHPGRYTLRVDRIGFVSRTTDPFDVPPDGTFQRIEVPIKAVELRGLDVEGARRCRVRPEEGQATAQVWEEIRKALQAAAWTAESGVYSYTLMKVDRRLDASGREVLDDRRSFLEGRGQAPYVSLPGARLVKDGFVQADPDSGTVYYAPDADALLSDAFLDTHCMKLTTEDRDGRLGLAFAPVAGRRLPDIEGVLWIDAESATLERLEFRFVNLVDLRAIGEPGGEVSFGRLPDGTWIVRAWRIWMPILDVGDRFRARITRVGYRDEGGVVWRVVDRTGALVMEATTATVGGSVVDSTGTAPAPGTVVRALATGDETTADPDGGFLLPALPAGPVALTVVHPSLDTLGLTAPALEVDAPEGRVVTARLTVPGVAESAAWSCGGGERPARSSIVVGTVRRADGAPAAGTTLRLAWLGGVPFAPAARAAARRRGDDSGPRWTVRREEGTSIMETTLDDRGTFLLCDVPVSSQLRVEAEPDTPHRTTRTVTVVPGRRVTVVRLTLNER